MDIIAHGLLPIFRAKKSEKIEKQKMETRILLINAIDASRRVETVYPPLNLAYLASYARSKVKENDVVFKIISKDYEKEILSFAPDIVGISCVTQNYPVAIDIASFCKKNNTPVFIGGIHISTLPDSLDRNFNFGVIGEAEETFFEIVYLFLKKRRISEKDLSKIDGLVYFDKNKKLRSE